jgi:hypothetical protein
MKKYLGVLFERREDGAFVLSQRQYLLNLLQRFGMEDCKPCATPCVPKKTIDEVSTDMSFTTFPFPRGGRQPALSRNSCSSRHLIHGWNAGPRHGCTKISGRCRCQATNALPFWEGDYGLVLGGTGESTLIAYSDADWGGDVDRKSTSGALHYFDEDLVHWTCKKQGCFALSTAEEEYNAASICSQDVIWLRGELCDLNYLQRKPTVIFEENTAAIKWSSSSSRRAKHIDLKVCFVYKVVSMKHATLKYLPTAE